MYLRHNDTLEKDFRQKKKPDVFMRRLLKPMKHSHNNIRLWFFSHGVVVQKSNKSEIQPKIPVFIAEAVAIEVAG